jgi:hypothetical protein
MVMDKDKKDNQNPNSVEDFEELLKKAAKEDKKTHQKGIDSKDKKE